MRKSLKIPHEKGVKRSYQKKVTFTTSYYIYLRGVLYFLSKHIKEGLGAFSLLINFQAFTLFIVMIPLCRWRQM